MATRDEFATAILAALGAPDAPTAHLFLVDWMAREGTTAANNPLATTLPWTGASDFNSVGVKNYPTVEAGVAATVQTLVGGYPRIVGDLRRGDGVAAGSEHGELSKWSGGGYDTVAPGSGGGGSTAGGSGGHGGSTMSVQDAVGNWLLDALSFLGLGFAGPAAAASSDIQELRNDSFKERPTVPLQPATLAEGVLKTQVPIDEAHAEAAKSGISADRFDALVKITGNPPGPGELIDLWRRHHIDQPAVELGLREGYLRNEWVPEMLKLFWNPTSPVEAVQGAVQNHLGYADAQAVAAESGVREDTFALMYANAGNPPGPLQLLNLWVRGYIDEPTVDQGLRESRLKDKWIEPLKKLAIRKVPLRSITQLLNQDAIDEATATRMLRELGYSPEDAAALIRSHSKAKVQTQKHLTGGVIESAYANKLITRDQAQAELVGIGYTADDASTLLTFAESRWRVQLQTQLITKVRGAYLARHIDEDAARTALNEAFVPGDHRDALLAAWRVELDLEHSILAPAQILTAGARGILSADAVHAMLLDRGYDDFDALVLMASHEVIDKPKEPYA